MKTYHGLQGLRYVAALLVVGMHTAEALHQRLPGAQVPDLGFGGIGVDIFFVISGFIMMTTTDGSRTLLNGHSQATDFLVKRLIRIAPLYWFYTTLKVVTVLAMPALALRTQLEPLHLACSYVLLPCMAPWGLVQPVLPVGWTLSFELLFYMIFAVSIAAGRHRISGTLLAFGLVFAGAKLWPESVVLTYFAQSILFEFCLGMLAYLVIQRVRGTALGLLCLSLGIVLACVGLQAPQDLSRLVTIGVPSFLIVLGVLFLEDWFVASRGRLALTHLGDSSYSLYLSHSFTVPLAVVVLAKAGMTEPWAFVAITALAATLVGLASFQLIERPVQRVLSRRWRDHLASSVPSPNVHR